jgi:PEGA domain
VVFTLARFFRIVGLPQAAPPAAWPASRHARRRWRHIARRTASIVAIGAAGLVGWLLAGGNTSVPATALGPRQTPLVARQPGGADVHFASTPSGATVRIDHVRVGDTPLETQLAPGQHSLSLQHTDVLEYKQTITAADTPISIEVNLWRRHPDVVQVRPPYPGVLLSDARWLDDGQLALAYETLRRPGAARSTSELWRFDPSTAQLERVASPAGDSPISVLAPSGRDLAYVTPGAASAVTASLWPTAGAAPNTPSRDQQPEAIWLAFADARGAWRIFDLDSGTRLDARGDPEHVVDLLWTPDSANLVVITRRSGPPVRSRVLLLSIRPGEDDGSQLVASELIVLPADIVPGSAVVDPYGRHMALITRTPASSSRTGALNLCLLELRPDGAIRDLADLGPVAREPWARAVAWNAALDAADQITFAAPVPAAPSRGGPFEFFNVFGGLRPSEPATGLFVANLTAADLQARQPRRLGTSVNTFGLTWRSTTTLIGFSRQQDGTLMLRSIDATSGTAADLGVRLPTTVGRGAVPLVRWDLEHGHALVLTPVSTATSRGTDGGGLQAWLVSFASPASSPMP